MIYFDNAATTKCDENLISIIKTHLIDNYFNPSAMYHNGIEQKKLINLARENILKILNGQEGQLIFTSSGSESDNLAILGSKKKRNSKILTTKAEHSAVYQTILSLEQQGTEVVYAPLDGNGKVIIAEFEKLVDTNTSFVSIMHVNNETGAINDIRELVKIAKSKNPDVVFHSDGVQAVGKVNINLRDLGVDLYAFSGHKIHSPKGIGGLYIRNGIMVKPLIYGGGQEFNIRSSTENVAFICAFEKSIEIATKILKENSSILAEIKTYIYEKLKELNLKLLSPIDGVSNILTLSSNVVRGEVMQHALEKFGILIGTGSACSSNKATLRVPQAIGLDGKYLDGIVRLSFSKYNTISEAKEFVEKFITTYKELQKYVQL